MWQQSYILLLDCQADADLGLEKGTREWDRKKLSLEVLGQLHPIPGEVGLHSNCLEKEALWMLKKLFWHLSNSNFEWKSAKISYFHPSSSEQSREEKAQDAAIIYDHRFQIVANSVEHFYTTHGHRTSTANTSMQFCQLASCVSDIYGYLLVKFLNRNSQWLQWQQLQYL